MSNEKKEYASILIRIPQPTNTPRILKQIALNQNRSMQDVIIDAIEEYIKAHKKDTKAITIE